MVDLEGFQGFHGNPFLKLLLILVILNTLIEKSDHDSLIEQSDRDTLAFLEIMQCMRKQSC